MVGSGTDSVHFLMLETTSEEEGIVPISRQHGMRSWGGILELEDLTDKLPITLQFGKLPLGDKGRFHVYMETVSQNNNVDIDEHDDLESSSINLSTV